MNKIIPSIQKVSKRSTTGITIKDINKIPYENGNVSKNHSDGRYIYRAFTPDVTVQKRPESRYNNATLFEKLENGRKSLECDIPIIDMKLHEYKWHSSITPSIWN